MKINHRSLLYISLFVLLLWLASYAHPSQVLGQTVPTGQITVTKEHLQHSTNSFAFDIKPVGGGIEVKFQLKDGESQTVAVSPGSYIIREELPGTGMLVNINCGAGGTVPGGTVPGGTVPGGVDLAHQRVGVTVASGGAVNCTFQNAHAVRIRVAKYNDVNSDGARNPGEKFLPNWVFTVLDSTGAVVDHPKKTNRFGRVKFESLPPGVYFICETLRDGWTNTQPGVAAPCYSANLAAGQEALLLFGNHKTSAGSGSEEEDEGVVADMAINPVNNPDEEYGPEWNDAPDAALVYSVFFPYAGQ